MKDIILHHSSGILNNENVDFKDNKVKISRRYY
jgi:hypothetical protein